MQSKPAYSIVCGYYLKWVVPTGSYFFLKEYVYFEVNFKTHLED